MLICGKGAWNVREGQVENISVHCVPETIVLLVHSGPRGATRCLCMTDNFLCGFVCTCWHLFVHAFVSVCLSTVRTEWTAVLFTITYYMCVGTVTMHTFFSV